jgi:peptide chain release factor 2
MEKTQKRSADPTFWQDNQNAQRLMKQMAQDKKEITRMNELKRRIEEIYGLACLEHDGTEEDLSNEIKEEVKLLEKVVDDLEFKLSFSNDLDKRNAVVNIHAGAGGVESQDWAEMLLRMYMRWAEHRGYKAKVLTRTTGDEAGIKSAALEVEGEYANGYLKSERGVHRLVRLSPFDADNARHTSFALVEVMPEAEGDVDIVLNPDELKIEAFRSSGPGGQHMQKTSSAIRITHIDTKTVVHCQSERSQYQNKEIALKLMRTRLLDLEIKKRTMEQKKLKGKHISAGWGSQIRSYILHPYRMVKDHRTDYETGNTVAVLNGELDGFIEAFLRYNIGTKDG